MRGPARREKVGGAADFILPVALTAAVAGAAVAHMLDAEAGAFAPAQRFAGLSAAIAGPAILALTGGRRRWVSGLGASLIAAALFGAAGYWSGLRAAWPGDPDPSAIRFWLFAGAPLCLWIFAVYAKTAFDGRPLRLPYPLFFENGLNIPLQAAAAALLGAVTFALAFAWAQTLEFAAGGGAAIDALTAPAVLAPVLGGAFGFALALARLQTQAFAALRAFVAAAAGWIAAVVILAAALLAAAVALHGLDPVARIVAAHGGLGRWSLAGAATAIGLIFLISLDEGRRRPSATNAALTFGLVAAAGALTAIAGAGLWTRIAEFGLTPARLIGAVAAGLSAAYILGATVAGLAVILPGRPWANVLRFLNRIWPALVFTSFFALQTPWADPYGLSAAHQLWRLETGRAEPEGFDFAYLERRLGEPGRRAAEKLRGRPEAHIQGATIGPKRLNRSDVGAPGAGPHIPAPEMLQFLTRRPYITGAGLPAMAINARVISGSDPGAVPGGSTISRFAEARLSRTEWGRNRIDGRVKAFAFARQSAVIGR